MGNEAEYVVGYVEPKSSIEVSQNAKGDYSFKVKFYFNEEVAYPQDIVEEQKKVYDALHKEFD